MPVTPIEARCRRCGGDFQLSEVRNERRGTCPRCGWILSPDWTARVLEEVARADFAQRHLVGALCSLQSLPGNLAVKPHTVLRNLMEEVGWQDAIARDGMLHDEIHELRRLVATWERREPAAQERRPSWLKRAAAFVTGRRPPPAPTNVSRADPATATT